MHIGSTLAYPLTPLPDESLHSIVCRYHRIYGTNNPRHTYRKIFGADNVDLLSIIPSRLGKFLDYFDIRRPINRAAFIRQTTTLCVVEPWNPEGLLDAMMPMFEINNSRYRKRMSETIAHSTYFSPNAPRYCPDCVKHDIDTFGIAYWHRNHQIGCNTVCHIHRRPLLTARVTGDGARPTSLDLSLPPYPEINRSSKSESEPNKENYNSNSYYANLIAAFVKEILSETYFSFFKTAHAAIGAAIISRNYRTNALDNDIIRQVGNTFFSGLNSAGLSVRPHMCGLPILHRNLFRQEGFSRSKYDCNPGEDIALSLFTFKSYHRLKMATRTLPDDPIAYSSYEPSESKSKTGHIQRAAKAYYKILMHEDERRRW